MPHGCPGPAGSEKGCLLAGTNGSVIYGVTGGMPSRGRQRHAPSRKIQPAAGRHVCCGDGAFTLRAWPTCANMPTRGRLRFSCCRIFSAAA